MERIEPSVKITEMGQVRALPSGGDFAAYAVTVLLVSNQRVVFSLDGQDPTPNSMTYGFPLLFAFDTTLKYAIVDERGRIGPVITESYNLWNTDEVVEYQRALVPEAFGLILQAHAPGEVVLRNFQLNNTGSKAVTIDSIKMDELLCSSRADSHCPFSLEVADDFDWELPAGEQTSFTIRYEAQTAEIQRGYILINSDAENYSTIVVQLIGQLN